MRRHDKKITDRSLIDSIIEQARVCRLAVADNHRPYIVPVCFGYDGTAIYIHGASEGTKVRILEKNNTVCFEFESECDIVGADKACNWSVKYRSVVGFGKAFFITDAEEKRLALDTIKNHYTDRSFDYPDKAVMNTTVIKIEIETITGKQSGF